MIQGIVDLLQLCLHGLYVLELLELLFVLHLFRKLFELFKLFVELHLQHEGFV